MELFSSPATFIMSTRRSNEVVGIRIKPTTKNQLAGQFHIFILAICDQCAAPQTALHSFRFCMHNLSCVRVCVCHSQQIITRLPLHMKCDNIYFTFYTCSTYSQTNEKKNQILTIYLFSSSSMVNLFNVLLLIMLKL